MLTPDAEEEVRYQAVQALSAGTEGAGEALLRALYDASWRVRRRAAERLAEPGGAHGVVDRLIVVLADRGQTGARNAAAEALVGLGSKSVPALVTLLGHADPDQRKFAADILGLIGDRASAAALAAAVEDEDPNVRVSAAEALGRVGGKDAPRALEKCLRAPDALLRLAAVEALTRLEAPPPLPVLVGLMEEPALRRVALRAMGLVRQPASVREILRALEDPSRPVREAGLSALGVALRGADRAWAAEVEREARPALRRGTEALVAQLGEVLASEDVEARRGAVFCLSLTGDPSAALQVARAAEDDRLAEDVLDALLRMGPLAARVLAESVEQLGAPARQVAAEAIARRADASLVPALQALLASAEPELRLSAVAALGRSGAREALPPLVSALEDEALAAPASRALVALAACFPDEVHGALADAARSGRAPAALQALAQVGGADAMDALRGAARHADPTLRAAAARAAGELGGPGAGELLRVGLSDESTEVRAAAARALGRSPSPEVAPLLRRLLADAEPSVRAAAVEAAGEVGGEELAPQLRALAADPDPRLATRAMKALSRMGRLDGDALSLAGSHPDPEVLREALVLGAALPEGVELARRHLEHPRWELRAAAARVLGASGGPGDLPRVESALGREQDGLVREALERTRAQLGRR